MNSARGSRIAPRGVRGWIQDRRGSQPESVNRESYPGGGPLSVRIAGKWARTARMRSRGAAERAHMKCGRTENLPDSDRPPAGMNSCPDFRRTVLATPRGASVRTPAGSGFSSSAASPKKPTGKPEPQNSRHPIESALDDSESGRRRVSSIARPPTEVRPNGYVIHAGAGPVP